MIRTYSELIKFPTFEERYEYLSLKGIVGIETFGYDRYLNQMLYNSGRWLEARDRVIIRDNGCDLGIKDREIGDMIIVHHMNPITKEDIELERPEIFDIRFLISASSMTHKAIHYGSKSLLQSLPAERRRNDTCPWRK